MSHAAQVALVTGAASPRGIGFATATALLDAGWSVGLLDVAAEPLGAATAAATDLAAAERVEGIVCDVTDRAASQAAVASALARFGRVDALVNNAGITAPTRLADIEEPEWDRIFAVDVKGVFLMTQAVLPSMRARRYGRIVNVSSVSGKRGGGIFGGAHYSAAKAAVLGFTKAVAREVAADGVTSNAVAPGMVDTDITAGLLSDERRHRILADIPVGRLGTTRDVAAVIAFLCSEAAAYITGEDIDINGGSHID